MKFKRVLCLLLCLVFFLSAGGYAMALSEEEPLFNCGYYVYYFMASRPLTIAEQDFVKDQTVALGVEMVFSKQSANIYYADYYITKEEASKLQNQLIPELMNAMDCLTAYRMHKSGDRTGDVDGDGKVTAADALLCLKMAVKKYAPSTLDNYYNALVYCSSEYGGGSYSRVPDAKCALKILQTAVGK